jgi:NADH-quinone oxidoreductase subunit C
MADETKGPENPSPQPGDAKSASPAEVKPTVEGVEKTAVSVAQPGAPAATPATAKPATPAGAAAPPKPAVPPKPAGPTPQPWTSPLGNEFKKNFGTGIEGWSYLGQNYFVVDKAVVMDLLRQMRDDGFDYCVDLIAVHYPKREQQFDIIWILYSYATNERVRVKTMIKEGERLPSSTSIWATTNWLERETYDMFGMEFEGHPDLKRILLPDGWKGHPLRKEYPITLQDQEWVKINLGIESGQ